MKTKIKITQNSQYGDYNKDETGYTGYIDGYINGADGIPMAVVVSDKQEDLFLVPIQFCRVISE